MNISNARFPKDVLSIRPWLTATAIGGIVGLLIWPEQPQWRFLAVCFGLGAPLFMYFIAPWIVSRIINRLRPSSLQFRLSTLLGMASLTAIGLAIVGPYLREPPLVNSVKNVTGTAITRSLLPDWTPSPFRDFAAGRYFSYVSVIELNEAKDTQLESLAQVWGADRVEHLIIRGSQVTDSGVVAIHKYNSLVGVHLEDCRITDVGLARLQSMPTLRDISVRNTCTTIPSNSDIRIRNCASKGTIRLIAFE